MSRTPFKNFVLPALLVAAAASSTAAQPTFQGLGRLPGYSSHAAQGISGDGTVVVGVLKVEPQVLFPLRAFSWTADTGIIVLPSNNPPIFASNAHAISADGSTIVGQNGHQAYAWTNTGAHKQNMGVYGDPPSNAYGASAHSVSADGSVVVGQSSSDLGQHAFRWTPQTGMTSLGYLPGTDAAFAEGVSDDGSVAVGWATPSSGINRAFRWTPDTGMLDLGIPPTIRSRAIAVSADGATIVGWTGPTGQTRAFRWTQATGPLDLGTLGASSQAIDVSADGQVIVGFAEQGAFVWDAQHGMRPIKSVLAAGGIDMTGWTLHTAHGVSADGSIITGDGLNPSGQSESWIARIDVPEPGAAALLLGCACLMRRR